MLSLRKTLCLVMLLLMASSYLHAATSAKITAVVLEVYWRANPAAGWARARVGTILPSGAQVRTGKRSACQIRFSDGSVVRLSAQTDMTVSKLASKDMSLGRGRLYANVVKGSGGATVRGGSGVASIKGTTWTNEVTGDSFTTSVLNGEVHVQLTIDGQATDFTLGALDQLAPDMGGVQSLLDLPASDFIEQVFLPWYRRLAEGDQVLATTEDMERLGVLAEHLQDILQTISQLGEQQGNGLIIDLTSSASAKASQRSAPMLASLGFAPPTAMLEVPPLTLAQLSPTENRVLGKRFMGPDVKVDIFGLWGDGPGASVGGMRVRPRAVWNSLYFEVGATGWSSFRSDWHTYLTEAFVMAQPKCGKVTLGRQHILSGPVNNSSLGTLFGYDTTDGVRFQPQLGDWKFDVAYLSDLFPLRAFDASGWYTRAQTNLWRAQVAANYLHQGGAGDGVSVDLSLPVLEGRWDAYGEFGDDPYGRHLETWGSYFPGLYQTDDIDLFVEYARRAGAPSLLSAYAYKEFPHEWTGLVKLTHTNEDHLSAGLGLLKRF